MAHLLDGSLAKLQRAEESIHSLDQEITAFYDCDPQPYKIVGQHQNGGLEYTFVAFGDPKVPLRFSVLAGEIIHHLRSSLDHLIYALIVKNGGTPYTNNQFPICLTTKKFENACKRGLINGVSESAKQLIMNVQPYTSPTPDDTVLHVINYYDIVDKHRLLVVVTTIVKLDEKITIGVDAKIASSTARQGKKPNIIGFSNPAPNMISKDGAEVFTIRLNEPAPELVAKANLVPQLAFEQCGHLKLVPVIQTLNGLLAGTRHTIEMFSGEF